MQVGAEAGEDVPPGVKLCHYAHTGGKCMPTRSGGTDDFNKPDAHHNIRISAKNHNFQEKNDITKKEMQILDNTDLSVSQYMLSMFHSRNPSRKTPREV